MNGVKKDETRFHARVLLLSKEKRRVIYCGGLLCFGFPKICHGAFLTNDGLPTKRSSTGNFVDFVFHVEVESTIETMGSCIDMSEVLFGII